jgi:hypothetical protein
MLTFPDGSKVGIVGLNEIMEDFYHQRKLANFEVASELMEKLETRNYFPSSEKTIYKMLLLSEYEALLEDKAKIVQHEKTAKEDKKQLDET